MACSSPDRLIICENGAKDHAVGLSCETSRRCPPVLPDNPVRSRELKTELFVGWTSGSVRGEIGRTRRSILHGTHAYRPHLRPPNGLPGGRLFGHEETAEFDGIATIDAIDAALTPPCGHQTDRIGNGRQLVQRLAAGDRWEVVFNIAEGMYGPAREAQVPAILDLYEIPYTFSDPLITALCLHKGMTKPCVARCRGAHAPTSPSWSIADVERGSAVSPFRQAGRRRHRQGN